ncbi:MAG: hypothetical protein K6F95_06565 [Selenomonas sp.]|nr:hypothetical protein [Selenomonas sp.]
MMIKDRELLGDKKVRGPFVMIIVGRLMGKDFPEQFEKEFEASVNKAQEKAKGSYAEKDKDYRNYSGHSGSSFMILIL